RIAFSPDFRIALKRIVMGKLGKAMAKESGQGPNDELVRQINQAFETLCQGEVLKYINTASLMFQARQTSTASQFEQLWAETDKLMRIKFDLKRFLYVGEKLGDIEPELCRHLP